MTGYAISAERPGDAAAIYDVVSRAFAPMPFSDGDEQDLVNALRDSGDLALSLVALDDAGMVIGHIGFSPATIDGQTCGWFQMAPVSVCPQRQLTGIGSALIRAGLAQIRMDGARGAAVVGNPAYYARFGFSPCPQLVPPSVHEVPFLRALGFAGDVPAGRLGYASAFG